MSLTHLGLIGLLLTNMSNQIALLEYIFLFDPTDTWSYRYEFESELVAFFKSKGFEAVILQTMDDSNVRRVLQIKPMDKGLLDIPLPPQKGVQAMLKEMSGDKKVKNAKRK